MVARGKPAVVLGYKTTNGVKEPCVMLGLIAHRDMDTIDDLLDPAYAKKVKNEHNTARLRTMGVKSVRFNLVEEIIPPSAWERLVFGPEKSIACPILVLPLGNVSDTLYPEFRILLGNPKTHF